VQDRPLATSVNAFNASKRLDGDVQIVATARPGVHLDTLQRAIDAELARLAAQGPTAREIRQALNSIEASFLSRLELSSGKADQLNAYYYATGSPDYFQKDLDRYRAVRARDVQRVVRTYLRSGRVTLSVVPQGRTTLAATARATR
ncbi:MAG: insulinase family protein, partial [Gemmatimonadota bacterium]|nr:insulinase family protein [Gemmatimonadota bacterium]